MASFRCFIQYVKNAQANSSLGILSHAELVKQLLDNGMSRKEIDEAVRALNELYGARVRQLQGRTINKQQRGMVDAIYGSGPFRVNGSLRVNEVAMMEDMAKVLGVPMINNAEMKQLKDMAQLADKREGSEKALVEEQIRNVLAQKNPDYLRKLNSSKISFKVLLSVGFNVMSYISNQKKLLEQYFIQRLRMQKEGKGFFAPYPLKDYTKYSNQYASAMAKGVRGLTNERGTWERIKANLGLAQEALLGPTAPLGSDISANSDALEHANDREKNGIIGRLRQFDRGLARVSKRILSSIDTSTKIKMGEVFYFNEIYKQEKLNNPAATEQQLMKNVYDNMYSVPHDDAVVEAQKQFTDWNIVDKSGKVNQDSNRFKVRVAEIMRQGRDPEMMKRAFEVAASKVWQGRMAYPNMKNDPYDITKFQQRLDSGLGGIIADALTGLRNVAQSIVGDSIVGQNLIFSVFGFINGAAAYWQDYMEHNAIYGGAKLLHLSWMLKNDTRNIFGGTTSKGLTAEQRQYLDEKITEQKGKVMFSLIETGMIMTMAAIANAICGSKGGKTGGALTDFATPDKGIGSDAASGNSQTQRPESSLNFCNAVSIPLEYLGGFSVSNVKFISNLFDQLENKNEDYVSAFLHATWLTAQPTISPLLSGDQGPIPRIWNSWQDARRKGQGYSTVYAIAERELSQSISNGLVRMIPIPNRLLKEAQQVIIPYRTYLPAGIEGDKPTLTNFMWQTGIQSVYGMGNVTGINQLIQISTTKDGLIGKPIFDYRHRPIDMGNLYDGKSVAGMTKPLRDLVSDANGKQPIIYDEKDHFLAVNDVTIPFDSRIYTVLYKKEPEKTRLMTDDQYYNYTYAYSKKFGEWLDSHYESLKRMPQKEVRSYVNRSILDIKHRAVAQIENHNSINADDLYKHL